jgi:hypothetical protein
MRSSAFAAALGAASLWVAATVALAQVPPHKPGTICLARDKSLWCWARTPGAVGAACTCVTPYGDVAGTLI